MQSINPATGQIIREYSETTPSAAAAVAKELAAASEGWHATSPSERAKVLSALERALLERIDPLAERMVLEMGKPIAQARAEIEKCAGVCAYYAEFGPALLEPVPVPTEAQKSYVCYEGLGCVLAIMPWNFPYWQFFRCAAPALLAGNTVMLKHASNVPGCSLAIAELFETIGHQDLMRSVLLANEATLNLIEDRHIAAVTLTGSTRAGRQVAARAGQMLKKSVLELGGSDPYLVLADADVAEASAICVKSRLINGGQSCIAAKRFIVTRALLEVFEERVVELMKQTRQGDPLDPQTELGPMAKVDLRDELHQQVRASVDAGASLLLGGERPDGPGAWYPATVLSDVRPGMAAFDEELFGPVAAIIPAEDEEQAILLANQSDFGLGAAVFSSDHNRAESIARYRLRAGSCFVNAFVRSDPRLPFGGVKQSGYGRELGAVGLFEFVNTKTVYVA